MRGAGWVFAALALTLGGCTSETTFGRCVGLNEERDPTLIYKANTTNVVVAIIFVETVVVPVVVALDELYCPIGRRPAK